MLPDVIGCSQIVTTAGGSMADGKCEWDKRCSCPAKEGRRPLNGCDQCPIDRVVNAPDTESLLMWEVPKDWRPTLNYIKKLPVCKMGR